MNVSLPGRNWGFCCNLGHSGLKANSSTHKGTAIMGVLKTKTPKTPSTPYQMTLNLID